MWFAAGAEARLRTKQHLLDVLCERIRDQTSYVRKDVLQVCGSGWCSCGLLASCQCTADWCSNIRLSVLSLVRVACGVSWRLNMCSLAVLQTWQMLAAANAIPLGHWQHVTDMATGEKKD